ncbi:MULTISPECIES: hypothetical protein [Dehalococcoides]|uniref:HEPN domain-containing protein n=1 Tax=Dehalococcoides mccartyi TaxID=61435 RepID=A0AB38Z8J1_9CHLR|nr:hypothetical protein [Dehalococcoides mccartyi]WRO06860.1 hypothetical protein VLL09_05590 [Dehalococcoides mccartyi]
MEQQEENKITDKYYNHLKPHKLPEGDIDLFALSGQRRNEAIVGGEDKDWYAYCTGYWRAADVLVDHLVQSDLLERHDYSEHWESIAYSILYLYRHHLELRLKQLFIACEGILETIKNEHSLLMLWRIFYERYEKFCKEYNLNSEELSEENFRDINVVEKIITQFDEIDKNSQKLRYPVDKVGKVSLPPMKIDMVHLREILGWANQFLDGWSCGIYECWQAELANRDAARHS